MRNKETENLLLNSLGSGQRGIETDESMVYFHRFISSNR